MCSSPGWTNALPEEELLLEELEELLLAELLEEDELLLEELLEELPLSDELLLELSAPALEEALLEEALLRDEEPLSVPETRDDELEEEEPSSPAPGDAPAVNPESDTEHPGSKPISGVEANPCSTIRRLSRRTSSSEDIVIPGRSWD